MATLKKFFLKVSGRNHEFFLGKLTRAQYVFWSNQDEYSLDEAVTGGIDEEGIPEDATLPYDYSDLPEIEHEIGPIVGDCIISVSEADGNLVFSSELSKLTECKTSFGATATVDSLGEGYYLQVEIGNKGDLFTSDFEAEEFDPKKLTFYVATVDSLEIATSFYYDENELFDTGAWSNMNKYFETSVFEIKSPLQKILDSAKELFDSGDISGAIALIQETLKNTKDSSEISSDLLRVERQLAIYKMENGDLRHSEALFLKNLAKWEKIEGVYGKGYAVTAGYYAANLVEQGKFGKAITFSERYLMSFNGAFHWYNLASALESVGRCHEADSAYVRAIELAKHKDDTRVKIGSLHGLFRVRKTDKKHHDEALDALNQAIEIAREIKDAEALEVLFAELKQPAKRNR